MATSSRPASLDALMAFPPETDGSETSTTLTSPSTALRDSGLLTTGAELRSLIKTEAPTIATVTHTRLPALWTIGLALLTSLLVLGVLARTHELFTAAFAGL